jgi:glycosyltransferase involved in cell wall biosynthesis
MLAEGSINPSMTKLVADNAVWVEKRRHERREQERQPLASPRRNTGGLVAYQLDLMRPAVAPRRSTRTILRGSVVEALKDDGIEPQNIQTINFSVQPSMRNGKKARPEGRSQEWEARSPCDGFTSLTLCVCTYRRPEFFTQFVRSVEALIVPADVTFHLAVADNNAESHYKLYIKDLLGRLQCPASYGHEPAPGYASARNKALELALKTSAELLAFVDDDMTLDPNWLLGQLRSYKEFACDVVGGAIRGRRSRHDTGRRFAHGEERPTIGTSNVSFKRWIVVEDGLGLRFDLRFNATGNEDKDFFSAAHRGGARIIVSSYPIVYDSIGTGDARVMDLRNKAQVCSVMYRNEIVRLRKEQSFPAALAAAIWGLRFGLKSLPIYLDYRVSRLFNASDRAAQKHVSAYKNFQKMVQGFNGLGGDYVAREAVRRSLTY